MFVGGTVIAAIAYAAGLVSSRAALDCAEAEMKRLRSNVNDLIAERDDLSFDVKTYKSASYSYKDSLESMQKQLASLTEDHSRITRCYQENAALVANMRAMLNGGHVVPELGAK